MALLTDGKRTAELAVGEHEAPNDWSVPTPMGHGGEPEWLPVGHAVEALVRDIGLVAKEGRILIFCGEAHPSLYGDPRFLAAARNAHYEKQAKIEVITGPVLFVSDKNGHQNSLLTLWEEEVISTLYHRRARYATNHFRVVQTDLKKEKAYRYFAEAPHPPLLPMRQRMCMNLDRLHPSDVHQLALQAIALFDSWKGQAVQQGTPEAESRPLLTSVQGLQSLMREAVERGLVFKYMDDAEILELPRARKLLRPYVRNDSPTQNRIHAGNR